MAHRNAVGRNTFGSAAGHGRILGLVVVFLLAFAGTGSSQTKPERQSNAVKPTQSSPANGAGTADQNASGDSESTRADERPCKLLKNRSIGPSHGARSLTAAGVPGAPTTYYFGATGGGVWK